MGLASNSVCWRFLSSVSEHETPKEFLSFYEVIKRTAIRKGLQPESDEGALAESKIQTQMVEAIGRSLQARPATLPAVGHTIRIQGEWWHVWLQTTQIPHLSAAVVERKQREFTHYRFNLVRELIEGGDVDYGKVEDKQLHGKTWSLYLHCKIHALKVLREAYSRLPFRKKPVLLVPNVLFSGLSQKLPLMSSITDTPDGIRAFLDQCDHVFVAEAGKEGLLRYLQDSSISPATFLNAQHSIASRIKAIF